MQTTLPISGAIVTLREYISHKAARDYRNTLTRRFLAPENKLAFEQAVMVNPNLKLSDFLTDDDADNAREACVLATIEKAADKDGADIKVTPEWLATMNEKDYEPLVDYTSKLQEAAREKVKN